jgi:pyruvate/2-oxoglutarate dehydrogenase complex dihydrolipoamide dehydrogenase (E3) component
VVDQFEKVDLLVVGSGTAGKALAVDQAGAGQRVVLVEREMIGGACVNVACVPTKSLVASARAERIIRRAKDLGILVEGSRIDLELLRQHETSVVEATVAKDIERFKASNVELVIGIAQFVAPRTVEVRLNGHCRLIWGRRVVIDTGSMPVVPDIPGLVAARPWTSHTAITLPALPGHLLVLGGGPVGCEFAQVFAALGTHVTIVERGPHVLIDEDEDIAAAVTEAFHRDGIDVRVREDVEWVERDPDTGVHMRLVDGEDITGDEILVAAGRKPTTELLGLTRAKVLRTDDGYIQVDEHLRTTAKHTWAAGDVAGTPTFTHASLDDYRIIKSCFAGTPRSTRDRLIPYTTFTTPELGRVGLTERQARDAGHDVVVATLPVAEIPRARTMHDTDGLWKAVIDAGTDRILGAALFGPLAGEVITTVHQAMAAGMTYPALRDAIICHPTMSEGLNLLFGLVSAGMNPGRGPARS